MFKDLQRAILTKKVKQLLLCRCDIDGHGGGGWFLFFRHIEKLYKRCPALGVSKQVRDLDLPRFRKGSP